jgi:GLPGLI family protein
MKNIKSIYILFFTVCLLFEVKSQSIISCGEITFEKKESTLRKIKENKEEDDNLWYAEMMKNAPKFTTNKFVLKFDETKSEYFYVKPDIAIKTFGWGNESGSKNQVYKDFNKEEMISLKQVFDDDVIFKDSIRKFQWKLSNEFRDVAGYECRKATTIINDSLYIIAYYSDQIICPTGPESFSNLPGTILGLVIPRMYLTWFATEVKVNCDPNLTLKAPTKGKIKDKSELDAKIKKELGQYKKWYESIVWALNI